MHRLPDSPDVTIPGIRLRRRISEATIVYARFIQETWRYARRDLSVPFGIGRISLVWQID